ncbi:MAG: TIGR01777 family oxidoreductase [Gammaproteobacteria bacterium]|nr:TIGR01777 family oxidoreductase [Gammaproteobacteria bacterium]
MKILLTEGTGLIGQAICKYWSDMGYELIVLSRRPDQVAQTCSGARGIATLSEIPKDESIDAIINLSGAPIADKRWSISRRSVLWQSRVDFTQQLVDWVSTLVTKPKVMISGSATGWYGNSHDNILTESNSTQSQDFGSQLCRAWEDEASKITTYGVRLILLRTAPVLSAHGGMLQRLMVVFKLGLGGRMGSGRQWMSWIHIHDKVKLIDFLLHHSECNGVFNACSPEPVRNQEFTKTLSKIVNKPAFIPVPAWLLQLGLGELSGLMLDSQRAIPERALEYGFSFDFPKLDDALNNLIKLHQTACHNI